LDAGILHPPSIYDEIGNGKQLIWTWMISARVCHSLELQ
jgi:hypothetical protein